MIEFDDLNPDGTSAMFVKTADHGRVSYEAYCAICRNFSNHLLIAASSPEILTKEWERFTGTEINPERIQHVRIVKAS